MYVFNFLFYFLYIIIYSAVKLGIGKSSHVSTSKEYPKRSSLSSTRPPITKRISTSRRATVGKSEKPKNGKVDKVDKSEKW